MRSVSILAVALSFTIAACGPQGETQEAASEVPTEVVDEGPEVASACRAVSFENNVLTHCTAEPRKHRIQLVWADNDDKPYRTMPDYAARRDAEADPVAFAMNAGMYDEQGKPIGYYVESSERLQELNRNDGPGNFHMKPNGVFYIPERGQWRVRTTEDFYSNVTDRPLYGTQSGPMLLVDGELHPDISEDGDSRKIRNGVGVDAAGDAHFVISEGPVSFGKLARYFRDRAKVKDALFLDGTVSALWDPAAGRMDVGAPLGPLIVVEKVE